MKINLTMLLVLLVMNLADAMPREREIFNFDWRFTYGHATDIERDFEVGTSYFTYLAKAGYGDGAASFDFDDRTWRLLDLPHDWAVEVGFSSNGSHSHGYKAVGPGFPESSVGWYRKSFHIPEEDLGKRIYLEFDGVFRDAKVWVNGFYCGNEPSGYSSFSYDITEYLNYGAENVVAVRVDASMEEGWFYEGAGIYRHVWITRTDPLHIPQHGTFVTSEIDAKGKASVTARITVINKNLDTRTFKINNQIVDATGVVVASTSNAPFALQSMHHEEYETTLDVDQPRLWDMVDPHIYELVTQIISNGEIVDEFRTAFGIRTIEWDPTRGFFLNGRHVKLQGTNNHQNHAGVGTAIPDALHEWRLRQLQYMGNNAYRTAHYPPTPALLEACDRMGMLVINENRLMGTTDQILDHLKRLMVRDRNHPSVILWSIGNEEWAIEGNIKGIRIAKNMQAFAKKWDTTRPINVAISGDWNYGISNVIEVMGFNYLRHGCTDHHHSRFPHQPSVGTEEGSTNTTRGIYFDDFEKQYLAAYDRPTPSGFVSIQQGWRHYAERDYLAGMFIWTGFDYRGESTPFGWPSVKSYFGMMDLCGFPKDNVYYLKSWWTDEPVLHILPHWNWKGREGEPIDVWVYSNFESVELLLNGESLGKQNMERNSHLSWSVPYTPGTLEAIGYRNNKVEKTRTVPTTGEPFAINLIADRSLLNADRMDVAVITVQITDESGNQVPDANHNVEFFLQGPGRIIGVGNGDPTSHEPDRYFESVGTISMTGWRKMEVSGIDKVKAVTCEYDDSGWELAFDNDRLPPGSESQPMMYRASFELDSRALEGQVEWMYLSIGSDQNVYVNGKQVGENLPDGQRHFAFRLDKSLLRDGTNTVSILTRPYVMAHPWDEVNQNPGAVRVELAAETWQRSTFNGLAQVLVQTLDTAGVIELIATSPGLESDTLVLTAQ